MGNNDYTDSMPRSSKTRLLDAALHVIRAKGYTGTTVDDICASAGVTKGSFFHHFDGKVDLALKAVEHWNAVTGQAFEHAPYRRIDDPRERLLAYIDFRAQLIQGNLPDFTCLLGTMVQETFETQPSICEACNQGIALHARVVAGDIAAAKAKYAPDATWDPEQMAYYTQAVIQGAFVLAKAQGKAEVAVHCIKELRNHIGTLLASHV
jgi:TetR/AcrR family transcriptional repressor of nem operon